MASALGAVCGASLAQAVPTVKAHPPARKAVSQFVENRGQWDRQAKFLHRSRDVDTWLTSSGFVFDYTGSAKVAAKKNYVGHAVSMNFVNHRPFQFAGEGKVVSRNDFFYGKRSARGASGYNSVMASSVYPGVDLRVAAGSEGARWDLIVKPQADAHSIRLRLDGAKDLHVDARGDLVYATTSGQKKQSRLFAYQLVDGKKRQVRAAFNTLPGSQVSFNLGSYDHTKQLVIDPLVYGSYFGSDYGDDEVHAVTADVDGGVYMTGSTRSTTFPATQGTHSLLGSQDAFVTLFQGDAYGITYNAYVGGQGADSGDFATLTPDRKFLYIAGSTTSTDLPGVSNSLFQSAPGPKFLMRFPILTAGMVGDPVTTYLGGDSTKPQTYKIDSLKVSPVLGNIVLAGLATDTVVSKTGLPKHPKPGLGTAGQPFVYILVLDPDLTTVRYAKYFGGTDPSSVIWLGIGTETFGNKYYQLPSTGCGLAVMDYKRFDANNVAYADTQIAITGPVGVKGRTYINTTSEPTAFPSQPAAGQSLFANGALMRGNGSFPADAYIAKFSFSEKVAAASRPLDANGIQTVYAGLLGGSQYDYGVDVALDPSKNAYVVARSGSFDYPRTRGVLGERNLIDLNLTKIDPLGSKLVYSTGLNTSLTTYSGSVWPTSLSVDQRGIVTIVGGVSNGGTVLTGGDGVLKTAYTDLGSGSISTTDSWINIINGTGSQLIYGSYIGSKNNDFIYRPFIDSWNDIWLSGWTDSFTSYTDGTTAVAVYDPLPSNHITDLAWKPHPDLPGSTDLSGYEETEMWGYPNPTSAVKHRRDGFVLRFRVGLPSMNSVTVARDTAPGGLNTKVAITATLNTAALSGGGDITLQLDSTSAASLSPTADVKTAIVHIAAGQTSWTSDANDPTSPFVYTKAVTTNTPVQVSAYYENTYKVTQLTVVPWIQQIFVSPNSVIGGNSTTARVVLYENAPSDVAVAITGGDANIVASGATITVPSGSSAGVGTVSLAGVDSTKVSRVIGTLLGASVSAPITITPARLLSIDVSPTEVTDLIGLSDPARRVTVTVTLDGKTGPSGVPINLFTNKPALGITFADLSLANLALPHKMAAQTSSESFYLKMPAVPAVTSVVLYARRTTDTAQLVKKTLRIRPIKIKSLVLNASLSNGLYSTWALTTVKGTITLSTNAPPTGATIYLKIKSGTGATIPASVVFTGGQSIKTFSVVTQDTLTTNHLVIRASRLPDFGDAYSTDVKLDVRPIGIVKLTLSPSTITGGNTSTGTIQLSSRAPSGGVTIYLDNSNPDIANLSSTSVVVPEGENIASFTIDTVSVDQAMTAKITASRLSSFDATQSGMTKSAILTVTLDQALVFGPNPVTSGSTTTGTLTIANPAPAGGLRVTLSSDDPGVLPGLPTTVIIPAGKQKVTFTVTAPKVSRDVSAIVTASYTGGSISTTLYVIR